MRKILLLLCTLCFLHLGYAQSSNGLKAGLNAATVTTPQEDNKAWRAGFYAGAFVRVPLSGTVFLQPELLYSLKGYGIKAAATYPKGVTNFHYLTLPLLAGIAVSDDLSLMAGAEFGYMLSARSEFDDGESYDVSRNFQDFDLGIDAGATIKVTKQLGIDLRYNHGLTKLVEGFQTDQYGQIVGEFKGVSNRVFQVGIHYLFPRK